MLYFPFLIIGYFLLCVFLLVSFLKGWSQGVTFVWRNNDFFEDTFRFYKGFQSESRLQKKHQAIRLPFIHSYGIYIPKLWSQVISLLITVILVYMLPKVLQAIIVIYEYTHFK